SIVIMHFSFMLPNTFTFIDLRFLILIYVFYNAGIIPTLVSGLGIILYLFGFSDLSDSTIISIVITIMYILTYYIISKFKIKNSVKISLYYIVSILIFSISLSLQIHFTSTFIKLVFVYFFVSLITYIIIFYLIIHIESYNNLFRKYKEESKKDFLTGLYNTRQYDLLLNSISKNVFQNNDELAYIIIDIDFFKRVNDTYGHDIGDKVLIQLAEVLKINCKSTEILSRIGGEEFCILSLGSNLDCTIKLAEALRDSVEKYRFFISNDEFIFLTISIGLSVYPTITNDINKLKSLADAALYVSKHNGRNRVSY
ncbi:MAG: Membrane associated domain containing protein, partial [Haloplasmataceae bacterium]|nr:Membrane associated domain containing protein [Haloplasmataceae bacterium]